MVMLEIFIWEVIYMRRFVILGDFHFNGALLYRRVFFIWGSYLNGEIRYIGRFPFQRSFARFYISCIDWNTRKRCVLITWNFLNIASDGAS